MRSLADCSIRLTMNERNICFQSGSIRLSGTLTLPDNREIAPAVILVPGSGHHDRDETVCGHTPFRTMAIHLAKQGFATLRFDGRGVGASGGSKDDTNFDDKVHDVLAARRFLVSERQIPEELIVLVGHSEGDLVAAAASNHINTPLAMLAGPMVPIVDLLHAQARGLSLHAGASKAQIAYERQMNERVFAELLSSTPSALLQGQIKSIVADALRSWPDLVWENETQIEKSANTMTEIVLGNDFRSLLQQNPAKILSALKAPVLALFGELDCQVEAVSNRRAFEAAMVGHSMARLEVLPRHNHLFQLATTGQIDEYEHLGQSPSVETLSRLVVWLREILMISN